MKRLQAAVMGALLGATALVSRGQPALSPAILKGDVTQYTFDHSDIFPGTERTYWIYVPRQYDPAKPACLLVDQDQIQFRAPQVLDELISEGKMPVTIAVFVAPGRVKAPSAMALDRFNRSLEFDALGDTYARFLLDELLPDVEKKTAPDGRPIRLSRAATDRAIMGSSSGAICAFTAAWERPDSFSRVFSAIGTYVDLRGGNIYPSLIRKFEPKAIRIFLQDGSTDHNTYGGDWWMANQEMERALAYAGYEVNHVWGTGDHDTRQATEIFPDAMEWLWKNWPTPPKAGSGSEQLQQILIPGEGWQLAGNGFGSATGPAVNENGEIFFNDGAGKTLKIGLDGKTSEFLASSKQGAGQAFGSDGRLYAAAVQSDQIIAYDLDGHPSVIADGVHGCNLIGAADGAIYVTQPPIAGDPGKLWYISPQGRKRIVGAGLKYYRGVTFSPDQTLLYLDDYRSHWVYSYQIQPDGSLAFGQKFYDLYVPDWADDAAADGMCVDRGGRLYVATGVGVQVCDQAGRVVSIIPTPAGGLTNLSFGGENFDILYALCGDKIFMRRLKVKGALPFEAPIKPAPPRL